MRRDGRSGVGGIMKRTWIIANPASGSVTPTVNAAVEVALAAASEIVGRTAFPEEPLPEPAELDAAGADTLVLLAGDGTINAAARAIADWQGALLILPGGTMNLLSKALHGDVAPAAIVAAAAEAMTIALPFAEAEGHQAYVGLILGPAASWNRARERLRAGRVRGLWRVVRHAWSQTMAHRVRIAGVPGKAQAVFVQATDSALDVATVEAADWGAIAELGWGWVTGDWVAARAVHSYTRATLRLRGKRPVQALFDGEPAILPPGTEVRLGRSRKIFLSTLGVSR